MWLKLSKKYRFLYVDQPVALYRWHESNSMKILMEKMRCAYLELLAREKAFCFGHGLEKLWREQYLGLLYSIVTDKNQPLSAKISSIKLSEIGWIFSRAVRKSIKNLHPVSHPHQP
jgi:hypothetical protein